MLNFALGVIVTLAIIYPSSTKYYFGVAVDVMHEVTTSKMKEDSNNE